METLLSGQVVMSWEDMYKNKIKALSLVCVLAGILLSGCRSVKVSEQVNVRDSVVYHRVTDTTRVTVTDTTHVEVHSSKTTETGTQIQFGAGGGTYNSKTGEATNVIGVNESSRIEEQRDSIADLKASVSLLQARSDELSEQVHNYSKALEKERTLPKRTGWDKFKTWWFWITAIILLAIIAFWICDKIPATKPYTTIIKAFFKFL